MPQIVNKNMLHATKLSDIGSEDRRPEMVRMTLAMSVAEVREATVR